MSSELEAAARLRRVATSTFEEVYGSGLFAFNPIAEDNRIVSAAALAMGLFREGDGEVATYEWARSEIGREKIGRMFRGGEWIPEVRGIDQWVMLPERSTRGQLRLLLRSLGIEVDNKP